MIESFITLASIPSYPSPFLLLPFSTLTSRCLYSLFGRLNARVYGSLLERKRKRDDHDCKHIIIIAMFPQTLAEILNRTKEKRAVERDREMRRKYPVDSTQVRMWQKKKKLIQVYIHERGSYRFAKSRWKVKFFFVFYIFAHFCSFFWLNRIKFLLWL